MWPLLRETWTPTPVVLVALALGPLPADRRGTGKPLPERRGSGHRILMSSVSGPPGVMSKDPQKLTQAPGPTQADQHHLNYFLKFFSKTLKYEVLH